MDTKCTPLFDFTATAGRQGQDASLVGGGFGLGGGAGSGGTSCGAAGDGAPGLVQDGGGGLASTGVGTVVAGFCSASTVGAARLGWRAAVAVQADATPPPSPYGAGSGGGVAGGLPAPTAGKGGGAGGGSFASFHLDPRGPDCTGLVARLHTHHLDQLGDRWATVLSPPGPPHPIVDAVAAANRRPR